jgi:hypothetical protein
MHYLVCSHSMRERKPSMVRDLTASSALNCLIMHLKRTFVPGNQTTVESLACKDMTRAPSTSKASLLGMSPAHELLATALDALASRMWPPQNSMCRCIACGERVECLRARGFSGEGFGKLFAGSSNLSKTACSFLESVTASPWLQKGQRRCNDGEGISMGLRRRYGAVCIEV